MCHPFYVTTITKKAIMAEDKKLSPMQLGKIRKKRINLLKAAGIEVAQEYTETFLLAEMPEDEFNRILSKDAEIKSIEADQEITDKKNEEAEAEAEQRFGEKPPVKSERERELELEIEKLKLEKQANKPELSQDIMDKVLAHVQSEMGIAGRKTNTLQDMELLDRVTQTLAAVTQQNQQTNGMAIPIARDQIDINDVLDEPIYYFAYKSQFALFGDKRMGQDLRTPYGTPIKFHKEFRIIKNKGSRFEKSVIAVCKAKIVSQKEHKFMEEHSLKDILFFEDINTASNLQAAFAEVLSQVSTEIMNYTQHQVLERARDLKIAMNADVTVVKRELVQTIAKERFDRQQVEKNAIHTTHPTATMELSNDKGEVKRVVNAPQVEQA